jgi:hypothetical protein
MTIQLASLNQVVQQDANHMDFLPHESYQAKIFMLEAMHVQTRINYKVECIQFFNQMTIFSSQSKPKKYYLCRNSFHKLRR